VSLSGKEAIKKVLRNIRNKKDEIAWEKYDENHPLTKIMGLKDFEMLIDRPEPKEIPEGQLTSLISKLSKKANGNIDDPITSPLLVDGDDVVCDFGLILTDCSMPFMDGYECSKIINQIFKEVRLAEAPPILAITGHVELEY